MATFIKASSATDEIPWQTKRTKAGKQRRVKHSSFTEFKLCTGAGKNHARGFRPLHLATTVLLGGGGDHQLPGSTVLWEVCGGLLSSSSEHRTPVLASENWQPPA